MTSVDFNFVDFDKILDKFIYIFWYFIGNYFLPTLPSGYSSVTYHTSQNRVSETITHGAINTINGVGDSNVIHVEDV